MLSKNIREITFAFLDVETTGLDPNLGDRICEIAILKTKDGKVLDSYETLINPGCTIPVQASSVNGITDDMVRGAPFFRHIAWDVTGLLKDSVVVAHNAQFDLGFLFAELSCIKLSSIENEVIDTLSIARRYYRFPSNSLGKIAKYLGISTMGEHRASGDVRITRQVFEYFLMNLERRGIRIDSLKNLLKLQGKTVSFEIPYGLVIPPTIEEALRLKNKIQIKYLSAYKNTTTTRVIEPFELNVNRNSAYLIAYCHLRKEKCSFRLDRILEAKKIN